jgi:hypothetical protein
MSSKEFLDAMRKAGEKYSEEIVFLTVARMRIQFGYSGLVAGERAANFFKPFGNPEDAKRVSDEVTARLKEIGSKREAVLAILLDIPEETNSGEKVTWDMEQVTFISNKEDSEWQILFNALEENDIPIDEWFWGSYKNEVVGEYERDGETKKRYLSIPVEKFDDETAAQAASNQATGSSTSQWSEKARATYDDMNKLEGMADEILAWFRKAQEGIPFGNDAESYPLPEEATLPKLKKYIANHYDIEPSDIDILSSLVIPF